MLDKIIHPSTRSFLRESRHTRGFRWLDFLHGYVYMRWPYFYIGIGTGEHPHARLLGPVASRFWKKTTSLQPQKNMPFGRVTFTDTYHGKVVPLSGATELVTVEKEITATLSVCELEASQS